MQIQLKNISYTYMTGTPFEAEALQNINCVIPSGKFVTVLGHTGSGKTTALQLIKGLLKPSSGEIIYKLNDSANNRLHDNKLNDEKKEYIYHTKKLTKIEKQQLSAIWNRIGYLFQYPEHQLFEETIAKDIEYGPRNYGFSEAAIQKNVIEAMAAVNLPYEHFADKSPFSLSGGQMRRTAIAGVLASKPQVMILDEPMAGLDPVSKTNLMKTIYTQHKQNNWTTLCVSHHIDEIWQYTDLFIIFADKHIKFIGNKKAILQAWEQGDLNIEPPSIVKLALKLMERKVISTPLSQLECKLTNDAEFTRYLGEMLC